MYTGEDLQLQRVVEVNTSGEVRTEFAMEVNKKGRLVGRAWAVRPDRWIPVDAHELWWNTRTDALYDVDGEFDLSLRPA